MELIICPRHLREGIKDDLIDLIPDDAILIVEPGERCAECVLEVRQAQIEAAERRLIH